nr:MAG TPA: hypothetical protein [Crassvirales sp.]
MLALLRIKSLPHSPGCFTFISRINNKSLAVMYHHKSAVLPTYSPTRVTRGIRVARNWPYIGGIVTVHLVGIIPHDIVLLHIFFRPFIMSLDLMNTRLDK